MKKLLFLFYVVFAACGSGTTEQNNTSATTTDTDTQRIIPAEECNDAVAQEKIQKAVSVQRVFEMSDKEAAEWLAADPKPMMGYQYYELDTLFDQHCVMSLVVRCEWQAAYPSGYELHYNFDKRTGDSIGPAHIFPGEKIPALVKQCDEMLQMEVEEGRKGLTPGDGLEDYDQIIGSDHPKFKVESLTDFYITDNSVTFVYHYAFPHVMLGIEPRGAITFSFEELKPFVKEDGPLAFILYN